jgi:cation/acetate symporter
VTGSHQTLTLLLFGAVIAVTLAITTWASRRRRGSPEEFYAGGRLFSPMENGFAIAGDYMSAASFLGISGLIALYGYDGMLYAVGFLVAWLVVLLLVAELVRNCGRFTLADVVTARLRERPVRIASGISCVTVCVLYLVAQMVGAGSLVALLLGGTSGAARSWTVIGVGALMVVYVCCGGMRATTWIQIVKAVLLLGGALALTVLVLMRFGGDIAALLGGAAQHSGHGRDFLAPGLRYGGGWTHRLDFVSLGLALVLGTAGLPHILSRFYTVPTARAARRSVVWSIALIGAFYLMTIVLGFGAAALLGSGTVRGSDPAGNTAVPLLSLELGGGAGSTGGAVLFALMAAVAFATILAVVAGITLASSASVAHDLYASLRRRGNGRKGSRGGKGRKGRMGGEIGGTGECGGRGEVGVARIAAAVVGVVAIGLGLLAQHLNVAFLVGLAFAVAAAANLPVLLYALFWRRFNTRGAIWSVYGGLVPAVALVVCSPVVSGGPGALFPGFDFAVFPLENPGLVAIPLGFLSGWLGTVTSREIPDAAGHAVTEVRSLTGAGAV